MNKISAVQSGEDASPLWTELAAQQLLRYQALFTLLDEIQATDDITKISERVAKRWKYFANVSSWRMVVTQYESFQIIDGYRSEARLADVRTLSPWDRHYWELRRPALVCLPVDTGVAPPEHMAGKATSEITVMPFFRMGRCIGMLSAAASGEALNDLDNKFIRLFGSYFADRISGLLLQKQAMEILTEKATTDALTGLLNRGTILDRLGRQLALGKGAGQPLSVILLDIDNFKVINDTYGHLAGDEVLREVARRCKSETREGDNIGRYGGEEFLIILYPCGEGEAIRTAERIRSAIAAPPFRIWGDNWRDRKVTMSLGTATIVSYGGVTMEALIKRADDALYLSKTGGRDRVTSGGQA
jgi:diguanylate cyclase (GGDEF)-like protein